MNQLEFYFDCSSPWTYLGFESIQKLLEDVELDIVYKPILVGGVFNTVNPSVYESRQNPVEVKQRYYVKDLQDWASYAGIQIGQPPVFPVNSVKAMRGAFLAIEQDCLVDYARAVFKSYWTDLKDISQDDVLEEILVSLKIDKDQFFNAINDPEYKEKLKQTTAELIGRGGYGSPTFFLNGDDMYFGNDRIELIKSKIS